MLAFIRNRRNVLVPLQVLLWRDMFLIGTMANLVFLAFALLTVALEGPAWAALIVFFLPLPYSIFIWLAVWRSASTIGGLAGWATRCLATGWLLIALVI